MTTFQKIIKYLAIAFAIFLIINIISGILFGLFSIVKVLGLAKNNKDNGNVTELVNTTESLTEFQTSRCESLNINLKYANLEIKKGNNLLAECNDTNISCEQNGNSLAIKENEGNNIFNYQNKNLTIYLPDDLIFDEVKIETGAGQIKIEKISTSNLYLEMGAGKTEIQNLMVSGKAKIDGGAGKVDIVSGIINDLDLDMGAGKCSLNAKLTGNNKMNAGIGKLEINLLDSINNYSISAEKGIGSIALNKEEMNEKIKYGNGSNNIIINGGVGSIEVNTNN